LASDYAGDHQESDYQVAAFLLIDRSSIMESWEAERLAIRADHFGDDRRFAFKKLGDRARQKALGPFLQATEKLNGIVFCAAIDKALMSSNFGYQLTGPVASKPLVLAKATRIAVLGSLLVGGLAAPGQELHWITDDDEIASNDAVIKDFGGLVGWTMHEHGPAGMAEPIIGIAGKFDDGLRAEDLCSIPDLVGGAMSESFNAIDKGTIPRSSSLYTFSTKRISTKASLILGWFSGLKGQLKRLFCLVRPHSENAILFSFASPTINVNDPVNKVLILPTDKGWRDSVRYWLDRGRRT